MKYRMKGAAAAVLAVLMIILSGCGGRKTDGVSSGGFSSSGGSSSAVSGGGNGGTASEQQNGGENVSGGGQNAEDPGAGGGQSSEEQNGGGNSGSGDSEEPSDTLNKGIDEAYAEFTATEFKYRDALLNKKNWEGKFAVFFLRSEGEPTNPLSGEQNHSGDNTLVISPEGKTMLVDCNHSAGTAYLVYFLQKLGIKKLDYFVSSHPHADHLEGYWQILDNFEVEHIISNYSPIYTKPSGEFPYKFYEKAQKLGIEFKQVSEGYSFSFGSVSVKVYNPPADTDWTKEAENDQYNPNSLALRLTYKKASLWLGGDCEEAYGLTPLQRMAKKYGSEIQSDIVKMNHHGFNMAGCPGSWLDVVKPKIAVGEMSIVQSDSVLLTYQNRGVATFHVALDGTVLVTTSGDGTYDIQTEKDRDEFSFFAGMNNQKNGFMRVTAG